VNQIDVLVCATEAGGARNLVAVLEEFPELFQFKVLSGNGALAIFERSGIPIWRHLPSLGESDAGQILQETKADIVLCGRGIDNDSLERHIIVAARSLGCSTVSIVDEWYDYRANYADESGDLVYLPDVVCCPDEQALKEAVAEGLPTECLRVTGSPALSSLVKKRETYRSNNLSRIDEFDRTYRRPFVTYISEELSDRRPGVSSNDNKSKNISRYDGKDIRNDILQALLEQFPCCTVFEKPHPRSESNVCPPISSENICWLVIENDELQDLCWCSDIVIGTKSMGLLEAALLGTPTVAYQPDPNGNISCTAVRKGLIPCFHNTDDLKLWFERTRTSANKEYILAPDFARPDAARLVCEVIEEFAS